MPLSSQRVRHLASTAPTSYARVGPCGVARNFAVFAFRFAIIALLPTVSDDCMWRKAKLAQTKSAFRPTRAKSAHTRLSRYHLVSPLPCGSGLEGCQHTPAR